MLQITRQLTLVLLHITFPLSALAENPNIKTEQNQTTLEGAGSKESTKTLMLVSLVIFHEALNVVTAYASRELKSGSPYFITSTFYATLGSAMSGDWQAGTLLGVGFGLQGIYNEAYLAKADKVSDARFYTENIIEYHIPWLAFYVLFEYIRKKPVADNQVSFDISKTINGFNVQTQYRY